MKIHQCLGVSGYVVVKYWSVFFLFVLNHIYSASSLRINHAHVIESFLNFYTSINICFMYHQIIAILNTIDLLYGDKNFDPYHYSLAAEANNISIVTISSYGKGTLFKYYHNQNKSLCIIF